MRAEELSNLRLAGVADGYRDGEVVDAALGGSDFDAVDVQEHQGCNGARSFVAIEERMVLDEVKQVGSGHLEKTLVEVFATERRSGLSDRRFEQAHITYAVRAAVQSHLIGVQAQQILHLEEVDHDSLFRQTLEIVAELSIDLAQ